MKTRHAVILTVLLAFLSAGLALAADPATPGKAQTVCPVMGGNIDKNLFIDSRANVFISAARPVWRFFRRTRRNFFRR